MDLGEAWRLFENEEICGGDEAVILADEVHQGKHGVGHKSQSGLENMSYLAKPSDQQYLSYIPII
eukprot:6456039-Amphidinium_carterae.1